MAWTGSSAGGGAAYTRLQTVLSELRAVSGAWAPYIYCASACCVLGGFFATVAAISEDDDAHTSSTHMAVVAAVESMVLLCLLLSGGSTTNVLMHVPLRHAYALAHSVPPQQR